MRTYGQYCGVARAADILTERWALLIVRDLLVAPMRFGELRDALGIPSNILSARLKELEASDVVARAVVPAPGRGVVYRLTLYGHDLKPIIDAIGLWGARRMDDLRPNEVVTDYSLASALQVGWSGRATRRTVWQVSAGPAAAWAITDPDCPLRYGANEAPERPDAVIGGQGLRHFLAGRLQTDEALASRAITIEPTAPAGSSLLREFGRAFTVPLD